MADPAILKDLFNEEVQEKSQVAGIRSRPTTGYLIWHP